MIHSTVDVVVVGYGPVGALLALQLAEAGLKVVVLERSIKSVELPRAVGLDGESVRSFQRLGYGDEVAALCQPPREVDEMLFTNSRREKIFGAEFSKFGEHGWRDTAFFDQPELEAFLRDLVSKQERIEVMLGREVVSIDQDDDCVVTGFVTAGLANGDALKEDVELAAIRSSFMIGCDGASSFVRESLGIEWESLGYDQDWLVVDVIQGPRANLPISSMQVCNPARLTTYICVKDPNRRWEFQLVEGETRDEMLRPEKIHELIEPWTAKGNYEIRRAAVYQFHAATASDWQRGRIFLAGDAAHQTPPFLGQGLNAGFRDAVNLGWKIPLVLSGVCDARLLETYQAERNAHAKDLVEWAVAIGQLMEVLAAREAGLPEPYPPDQKSGYRQGRTTPPLRGGVLMMEQGGDSDSRIGSLLRQPTLRDSSGKKFRLDELLGSHFSVLGRVDADLEMSEEARDVFERLGGRASSFYGLECVEGDMDRVFETASAVVLRPDRIIFGIVDKDWSLDQILMQLQSKLGLI